MTAEEPTWTLPKDHEAGDRESAAPVPVPARETVEGLPAALWGSVKVPDCAPVVVGANETVMLPVALVARLRLEGETVNCALLEVMEPTESVPVPVLVTVNACVPDDPTVTFPKESEVKDREMAGLLVPVPDRETVDGLPVPLWGIDNVPVCDPEEVGAKVTVTVRLEVAFPDGAATVNVAGLTTNCGLLEVIVPTESAAVPELEMVNVWVADDPKGL